MSLVSSKVRQASTPPHRAAQVFGVFYCSGFESRRFGVLGSRNFLGRRVFDDLTHLGQSQALLPILRVHRLSVCRVSRINLARSIGGILLLDW